MLAQLFHNNRKLSRRFSSFVVAAAALIMTTASVSASGTCQKVQGHYNEHFVFGEPCTAELCVAGDYSGDIQGDFFASILTQMDGAVESVQIFTSNTVIHARIGGREGDLIIANSGAYSFGGDIVDLQFITGGMGELEGASGAIRASGTFDFTNGTGRSDYEGNVCLP
jgi:hypothetical protein